MKFTTILFSLSAISTTVCASSPNPSNTNIRINSDTHLAISKSKVTSSLGRAVVEPATNDPVAVHRLSNAIRDASTVAARATSGRRGMSRRTPGATMARVKPHLSAARRVQETSKQTKKSSMGKAQRRWTRETVQQQQQQARQRRRESRVPTARR